MGGMWKVIVFGYELSSANTLRFFADLLWAMGYQMFQVIVKSPMSRPPASDLKAPKLKWARNCDRPKSLCSSYCKAIMLCSIR
jgi:hypothetical protein